MATIDDLSVFEEGSTFHTQQLKAEIFKQSIRRDARRIVEDREREQLAITEIQPMMIYDPLPTESPELMPGLLPESGTAAIVGETNTGKSLIAIEIASSLLTGEPLWGHIKPNRTIKKVLYILGEHTCVTIQGLYHRTQLPASGNFHLIGPEHLHPHKALVIGGVQQITAVDRLSKLAEGAELVVFDPIAGFVQGLAAENDNATMRTLIDSMSLIASRNGAACLVLSHMGKPMMDQDGNEVRRNSYATRGATATEDSLTHIFYLKKGIATKQMGTLEKFDLVVRKFKGNPSNDIFRLERDPETKRNTITNVSLPKSSYPSAEDKASIRAELGRLQEQKPDFSYNTCIEILAGIKGISSETLRRYLQEVPEVNATGVVEPQAKRKKR